MSYKSEKKEIVIGLALLFFPVAMILGINSYDEIFTSFCILYFIITKKSFTSEEKKIIACLIISYLLGIISNLKSNLISVNTSTFIDLFSIYKHILVFIFLRNIITLKNRENIIRLLTTVSKIFIISAFIFGIISQFIDTGMTASGMRYGIKPYSFVFKNHSQFGIIIIASFIILSSSQLKKKDFIIYFLFSTVSLILTTKGVVYSFLVFCIAFSIFLKKIKIKIKDFILPVALLVFASTLQINTYIKNENSIRMIFIKYGIKTANNYFPLGSGFATYGSAEAAKNYSPLYKKYGFNAIYGLNEPKEEEGGMFLNDNYWATIIGELGYIGFILMLIMYFYLFKVFNDYKDISPRSKILVISALLMLFISSIATGIIKSVSGAFLFSVLAIILPNGNKKRLGYSQKKLPLNHRVNLYSKTFYKYM